VSKPYPLTLMCPTNAYSFTPPGLSSVVTYPCGVFLSNLHHQRLSALANFQASLEALCIPMVAITTIATTSSSNSSNSRAPAQLLHPTAAAVYALQASIPGGIFALITDDYTHPVHSATCSQLRQDDRFKKVALFSFDSANIIAPSHIPAVRQRISES
jgi:hypothetical protein